MGNAPASRFTVACKVEPPTDRAALLRTLRRGAAHAAPSLIGCTLERSVTFEGRSVRLSGVILETEAYVGVEDRACHAFGGRRTQRVQSMYLPSGRAYVYFTYGMHHCFNIVCAQADDPQAVLVRAVVPTEGLDFMRAARAASRRRGNSARAGARPIADRDLCSGPAKFCQAFAIDGTQDGGYLMGGAERVGDVGRPAEVGEADASGIALHPARGGVPDGWEVLASGPRIGVGYAQEWAAEPLRWFVDGHPYVSGGGAARS